MARTIRIVTMLATTVGALLFIPALANAQGENDPGVASGNVVQAPVEVPANVCGNTINVVGLLNPATGNTCINK